MAAQKSSDLPEGHPLTHGISVAECGPRIYVQLPPELRLHIWEQALPGPRIIAIRTSNQIGHNKCIAMDVSNSTLDILRRSCKASEFIVSVNYPLCFEANFDTAFRFCGEKDILHFHDRKAMDKFFTASDEIVWKEIKAVRKIAINVEPFLNAPDLSSSSDLKPNGEIARACMRFGGVTEIILLQPESFGGRLSGIVEKVSSMKITLDEITLSRDMYVQMRRATGLSPLDQTPDVKVTAEEFSTFQERAGSWTTQTFMQ
ncbi:uncharacterized protein RAG0_10848 [Rhynchosporium agropyri]|uniref:2EXR domain-containing protein n=1 Tax=Rhynchosporium agropyri TaxID=914238 RepID=A0A1E1L1F7_9HELO|nr:uncharacterized protein RAG0_10848 [Rhynchosporium agropyri]